MYRHKELGDQSFDIFLHNIKAIMGYRYKSCAEFARYINVDPKRLSEVVKGRLKPTYDEINKVAMAVGVTTDHILNIKYELKLIIN